MNNAVALSGLRNFAAIIRGRKRMHSSLNLIYDQRIVYPICNIK